MTVGLEQTIRRQFTQTYKQKREQERERERERIILTQKKPGTTRRKITVVFSNI